MIERILHLHAQRLLEQELRRRRGALARLPAGRRAVVEELVAKTVAASVDAMLDCARDEASVADALECAYASRSVQTPVAAGAD